MSAPPYNREAEESVLGAMLLSRDAIESAAEIGLTAADFYAPAHQSIFLAIFAAYDAREGIDPVTIAERLRAQVGDHSPDANRLDEIGGRQRLLQLQAATPASANAPHYARIVARTARWRRAAAYGEEVRLAALAALSDDGTALDGLLDAGFGDAPVTESVGAVELDDLLAADPPVAKPWIVPGILRGGENLVVTGGEGAGKMTLLRQMAVGAAAGVHPFTDQPIPRSKVLIVDLQEDLTELQAELAPLRRHVDAHYRTGAVHLVSRRQGVNLLAARDARWFEGLIVAHAPAFVVMGPLKKMYQPPAGARAWDHDVVEALHRRIDDWQERYGFALALEGHAGHDRETWRVLGSSVWYAWPHFGYGLKPVSWRPREVEMMRWRGERDGRVKRHFPARLTEGAATGWPWLANPACVDELRKIAVVEGLAPAPLDLGDAEPF